MRVSEAMSKDVRIATPGQTIREVARTMGEMDAGFMPVGENDRLVGTITDRDIAVRAVGAGKDANTPVRVVMTPDVKYCFEDQDLDEVVRDMGEQRVRRLPVLNRDKRLVGVVALGDVARTEPAAAAKAAAGVSQPGGPHSQKPSNPRQGAQR